jgi:aminoglycoside phosphotransferase (APT) family kinase protein
MIRADGALLRKDSRTLAEHNRTSLFSGVETPAPHLAIDAARLTAYLAERLEGFAGPLDVKKFRGGQSNPTYRIASPRGAFVLRKKPAGVLLPSAHAIDREFRVIKALHAQGFAVPAPILFCADEAVVGTAFYLVEAVEGRVFWDVEMPGCAPEERCAVYDDVIDFLARLHTANVETLGLQDFGAPGDYLARQLSRWGRQFQSSRMGETPDMDWLMAALDERRPTRTGSAVVHGDFGLHNIIVRPDRPSIAAVLDWEIATLGDPLADLAHYLTAWYLPPDPEGLSVSSLVGRDLVALGIPEVDACVERYCATAGLSGFPDRDYYIAFALFRYAAIIQGILKRAHDGTAANRNVLHTPERVTLLAQAAGQLLP